MKYFIGFWCPTYLQEGVKSIQLLPILLLGFLALHIEGIHGDHSPEPLHQSAVFPEEIGQIFVGKSQANGSQLGASTMAEQGEIYGSIAGDYLVEHGVGGGGIEALAELQDTPFVGQGMTYIRNAG